MSTHAPSLDGRLSKTPESGDDASADLSVDSDIRAISREAHELLSQILNDSSDRSASDTTSPSKRKKAPQYDTASDGDDDMEAELGRVADVSDNIKALSAELINAVLTNTSSEVLDPVHESEEQSQLELLAPVGVTCQPMPYYDNQQGSSATNTTMIRFDPAVEELKALRVAIANKDIAPAPPRGRALKKQEPGQLERGVHPAIFSVFVIVWTITVILVDHTRTGMVDYDGKLRLPWIFKAFS
jgi:hypothetical protein